MLNTLTGTIDNFNLSGGEDNEWAVSLQGDRMNIDTGDGTASGMAQGGGDGGSVDRHVPWPEYGCGRRSRSSPTA